MATEADFEREIAALRGGVAAAGAGMGWDGALRARYTRLIDRMAQDMKAAVRAGRMTWAQAAAQANEQRNVIMDLIRSRSTPVARALAQDMKGQGLSLQALLDRKAQQLFGHSARFDQLSAGQRDQVFRAVVEAAGRSNPRVNVLMRRVSTAGRGLLILSLGIAVYNVATAEDHAEAAIEEGAILGGGVLGGLAGGAAAGLVCGPGALVCSSVGAFAGAVAGAFGVSLFF
ncbi:hypothetical protein MLD63_10055 [Paracoccus sp. TK19116]|uniref:Uncharacterized protein n=1 Tax=Paracoccus albicereus TaxID=2922394 RepID=A0ABT1MR32_9RHOB|nr:hypothetical protein [Paracoccus albicereus]MCQ0970767.1 hypothetical protein [Paracoccus albicereus]